MVLLNAAVSYGIVRLNAPVTVAFNMKQTVDAFFDSASQKRLFRSTVRKPFQRVQIRHCKPACRRGGQTPRRVVLAPPAVVQGGTGYSREIQQEYRPGE
ncbi:TrbI F-type domain-containing protein [Escherichia coli]|uniref:TrbI F-type domain-containing protein n=1 Tax=Escherichia coli TaxID=562 RepID=UPI003D64C84B